MFASAVPQKPVLSPCTGVCRLDDAGYCVGCHRSGDEIARWLQFSDAQRRRLMNEVLPRRANANGDAA
ncbi:MAG TPA: DUF1289 domain-containing protein [Rudaea sp.]|jgi:predicted Fe-S protein YdhL (DUF1289 family)|nr:DUF1289 domain-containing protein [Rudaea sp.]